MSGARLDEGVVLARYRAAFAAANEGREPPRITYWGRGWYVVDGRGAKRRLKEFVEWAERMEARAVRQIN